TVTYKSTNASLSSWARIFATTRARNVFIPSSLGDRQLSLMATNIDGKKESHVQFQESQLRLNGFKVLLFNWESDIVVPPDLADNLTRHAPGHPLCASYELRPAGVRSASSQILPGTAEFVLAEPSGANLRKRIPDKAPKDET